MRGIALIHNVLTYMSLELSDRLYSTDTVCLTHVATLYCFNETNRLAF